MPQSTPDQVTLRLTFKVKQMHAVTGTDSWNRHQQRHNSSPNGCQQRVSESASPSTPPPPPLVAEGAAICMAFFTRGDERPGEINAWPRCGRLLLEHCEIPRSERKKKRLGVEDCFLGMPACISTKALPWQGVWLPQREVQLLPTGQRTQQNNRKSGAYVCRNGPGQQHLNHWSAEIKKKLPLIVVLIASNPNCICFTWSGCVSSYIYTLYVQD